MWHQLTATTTIDTDEIAALQLYQGRVHIYFKRADHIVSDTCTPEQYMTLLKLVGWTASDD